MELYQTLVDALPRIVAILIAVILHELGHGIVADRLGDPTPRAAGRLTLNPIPHLDLMGTLMFLFVGLGWAKPVPVNPYNYRDQRNGDLMVSLAGVTVNFALALMFALVYKLLAPFVVFDSAIPGERAVELAFQIVRYSIWINVALGFFNLIPIPPLDGSHVLAHLLPPKQQEAYRRIGPYGILILLALVFTGGFRYILFPLVNKTVGFLVGI